MNWELGEIKPQCHGLEEEMGKGGRCLCTCLPSVGNGGKPLPHAVSAHSHLWEACITMAVPRRQLQPIYTSQSPSVHPFLYLVVFSSFSRSPTNFTVVRPFQINSSHPQLLLDLLIQLALTSVHRRTSWSASFSHLCPR